MEKIIKIGQMPGFESENRVYSPLGICPSIKIGGDPKKVIEIRQATKQGTIPCEVGGGGRFELSQQHNTQRKGARERADMSNIDNGEYP